MPAVTSPAVERFRRLPRMSTETWQGGLVRLPQWIHDDPDSPPYRPWAGVWVSLTTGLVNVEVERARNAHDANLALTALIGLGRRFARCRPARLEVEDEALGTELLRALGEEDLALAISPSLPVVTQRLSEVAELTDGPAPPDALTARGVTVDRMRAFARAASRFYVAAPWRHLSGDDLIHVEAPRIAGGLEHITVLGAGGEVFGLGFFERVADFGAMQAGSDAHIETRGSWSVLFGPMWDMPFGDVNLWEEHDLPVAGPDAYPVAVRFGPEEALRRPDAAVLSDLEGLLLALAETTEAEIDRGRWSRTVRTHAGSPTFTLAIPALLEPLDAPLTAPPGGMPDRRLMERMLAEIERFVARSSFESVEQVNEAIERRFVGPIHEIPSTATTPLEKAQEVMYRAFAARGRRRIQLARKALELSRDCADAYVVLAEHSRGPDEARELYAQGVAAGERTLGPDTLKDTIGRFWSQTVTRPYMRARFGLAQSLEALGRVDEAIDHYRELLRLNPNDNQGVRDLLLPALLGADRDDEAGSLLEQYADDPGAAWRYGWALWIFRREGDSRDARERLRAAVRANRHVPAYFAGEREWPGPLPTTYAFGSDEEAAICESELGEVWQATPGAERWLNGARPKPKRRRRRRR